MTLLAGILLFGIIVIALYAFGIFDTPYLDGFRAAFYLLLVLLILSVWFTIGHQPTESPDRTVGAAK